MTEKLDHGNPWMPVMYVTYFGILKQVANDHGYALAVHGSCYRDFDLIAIPWTEDPKPAEDMLMVMADKVGIYKYKGLPYTSRTEKPHGRIAYTIPCGSGGYFDISIMPALIAK